MTLDGSHYQTCCFSLYELTRGSNPSDKVLSCIMYNSNVTKDWDEMIGLVEGREGQGVIKPPPAPFGSRQSGSRVGGL